MTTAPVVVLNDIAEACKPMAAFHHALRLGLRPGPELLEAATLSLAQARHSPGRVGQAIRLVLDGPYGFDDLDAALEVIIRVADYAPAHPTNAAPRRRQGPRGAQDPNQLVLPGFSCM